MKTRYLIGIIALSLVFGCNTVKTHTSSKREAWIRNAVLELKSFEPTPETKVVKIHQSEEAISFRIHSRQMLKDVKGNWVYFISHSSHQEHGHLVEQDENGNVTEAHSETIGNVSLAIDNKGNIYQSNKHPCSAIIHMAIKGKDLKGLNDIKTVLKNWVKREDL